MRHTPVTVNSACSHPFASSNSFVHRSVLTLVASSSQNSLEIGPGVELVPKCPTPAQAFKLDLGRQTDPSKKINRHALNPQQNKFNYRHSSSLRRQTKMVTGDVCRERSVNDNRRVPHSNAIDTRALSTEWALEKNTTVLLPAGCLHRCLYRSRRCADQILSSESIQVRSVTGTKLGANFDHVLPEITLWPAACTGNCLKKKPPVVTPHMFS